MKNILYTKSNLLTALLLVLAMAFGQNAWATTKTVTYRITDISLSSGGSGYNIVFTRSGDAPFDTSAPTTYTVYVPNSYIGQTQGGSGSISVDFADGFRFNMSWGAGSDIKFIEKCIYPNAENKYITYAVSHNNTYYPLSPDNTYYYVTHVMMTGTNSGYQQGLLQPYPHYNEPIDYDYNNVWNFYQSYMSRYAFGQLTVTYTDVPALSIFESAGENTYNIKSKDDLRHLANYVNNGHNDCNGLTFLQTQAIACDATYVPIGFRFSSSNRSYFKGTYDGQGHTVSGITVSRTGGSEADGCIGLFGYVEYGGTVQNVVLASSTFTGYDKIGGIVGLNWSGTVKNCRVESSVTIKAGCNNAWNHGGIVGYNDSGTIEGCVSAASILNNGKSSHQFCGGITGRTSRTIRDCLYTGTTIEAADYKGAICGYSDGGATYANNYYTAIALGGVGAEGGSSDQDGARRARTVTLGENVALAGDETTYEIQNHSSLTAIGTSALRYNNTLYSGATQTLNLRYSGEALATGYAAIYSVNETPIARNTFEVPASNVSVTVAVADVWGVSNSPAANGSAEYPYLISSTYALDLLAKNVNGTDGHTANEFNGKHFLQTASLTYDGIENNYTPIGKSTCYFRGQYDGDGKTISGINISGTKTNVGLFGYVYSPGVVENVILASSTIKGSTSVGGIVGCLYGDEYNPDVSNCRVESDVIIGTVIGGAESHGGIVGTMQSGIIAGCFSAATVTNNDKSNCKQYGGIVGNISGNVTIVKDCLYVGNSVTAGSKTGAIVGYIDIGSTLTNNYHTNANLGGVNGNDQDGARRARTVTLGENVALVGSETAYSVSGLTAIGTGNYALSYNDGTATTFYSGNGQTLTLSYTGTVPEGSSAVFSTTGGTLSGNMLTMPNSNVTVNGGAYKNDYVTHWQASPLHDGSTSEKAYIITTPAGLQLLSSETNGGTTFINTFFKLGGDIDMSSVENFTPIGINSTCSFNGTFDGRNHTISHLTINYTSNNNANNAGLFGCLSGNIPFPVICNLTLDRANISGKKYVGGIVGYLSFGTVSNCHVVNSTIKGTDTTPRVGAIVGYYNLSSNTSLNSSNYHSTLVYANSNVKAFNIGCGDWGTSSHQGGDSGSACLDATQYFLDGSRTNLNELMAAYDDPANYTAYDGPTPDLSNLTATVIGNVTIPSGIVLKAQTVTIATGGRLTLADGAELVCNNAVANVIVQKNIARYTTDKNGWNLITMPYMNNVNPLLISNLVPSDLNSTSYDLYRLHTPTTIWENYKQHHEEIDYFFIGKEKACLYATSTDVTLQIHPSIPTQTVPYTEEGNGAFLTQSGDYWNLIGNPYTFKAYADRPYYRMNATGTALELVENYWQVPLNVCEGIVVQADNSIPLDSCNFTRTAPVPPTSGAKGSLQIALSQPVPEPVERAGVSTGSTTGTLDKAVVSFTEGSDLGKFYFLEQDANIYLPQGGKEYAIASVSAGRDGVHTVSTEVPVNFKARKNGTYTLTVNPEGVEMAYLHLIDNMTGADVDLLGAPARSYSFTAKTTDYASRFRLVFAAKAPSAGSATDDPFAFCNNGDWIISNPSTGSGTATLQAFDMLGRQLSSQEIHSTFRIPHSAFPTPGVYVLRLINDEEVRTQKIVVR